MKIKDQYIEYLESKDRLKNMSPQSIANLFAGVQPMSANAGKIFKFKHVYKDEN